jgi:hypothetical protein
MIKILYADQLKSVVKLRSILSVIAQQLTWSELNLGVGVGIAVHLLDQLVSTIKVNETERTAPKLKADFNT